MSNLSLYYLYTHTHNHIACSNGQYTCFVPVRSWVSILAWKMPRLRFFYHFLESLHTNARILLQIIIPAIYNLSMNIILCFHIMLLELLAVNIKYIINK